MGNILSTYLVLVCKPLVLITPTSEPVSNTSYAHTHEYIFFQEVLIFTQESYASLISDWAETVLKRQNSHNPPKMAILGGKL